jgi:hypothetical protein
MTDIKYKIIYKDATAAPPPPALEIDLSTITTTATATPYDLKTFKESLKKLLADNSSVNVVAFLGEFVKIANTQVTLVTTTTTTTPADVNPFIFAIDTTNGDKVQRTYLTFTGTSSTDAKVIFNQYSVDKTIFTTIDTELSVFNDKLITKKYSDYTALTATTTP